MKPSGSGRDGELRERRVVHALLVRPGRRDDLALQVVVALGALLDGEHRPGVVPAGQRPVLAERHGLILLALAHDALAHAVLHEGLELRLDPDDGAVLAVVLAVDEADVPYLGVREHPHAVLPALALEVVEPALPLDQQVRADQPCERRPVTRVPGHLRRVEERDRVTFQLAGREVGVVLGRLRGGGAHARVALAHLPAVAERVDEEVEQEQAEQPEHDDHDERVALAGARGASAAEAAAPASSPAAEPGAAGPGLGEEADDHRLIIARSADGR